MLEKWDGHQYWTIAALWAGALWVSSRLLHENLVQLVWGIHFNFLFNQKRRGGHAATLIVGLLDLF